MVYRIDIIEKATGDRVGSFIYSESDYTQETLKAYMSARWTFNQVDLSKVNLAKNTHCLSDFIENREAFERVLAKD